jgi:WS/DGAT/MGAT family acyltransferase
MQAAASRISAAIATKLGALPAFRRRLVEAPLSLAHPAWVEVPRFRPAAHVRWAHAGTVATRAVATREQFAELVGRIAATPLPRDVPLWELWMVERVEGDHIGVVLKAHHAIIDGVSGLGVLAELFTTEPGDNMPSRTATAPPDADADIDEGKEPGAAELAASAVAELVRGPAKVADTAARTLPRLARGALDLARSPSRPALLFTTPRTELNRALTSERVVAFGRVPLATIKRIKNAFGVTVNDVVLAACTLALREYLASRGDHPDRPLVASVPVSEHGTGAAEHGSNGHAAGAPEAANKVSAMFVGLPVHLDDPAAVVRAVQEQARRAKDVYASIGPDVLARWVELAPPALFASLAEAYSRWRLAERLPPIHSIVISNVPGPPVPLYLGRTRLESAYPLGPVLEGAALNVSVVSYAGWLDVGVIACPRSVERPAELTRAFEQAVATLDAVSAGQA